MTEAENKSSIPPYVSYRTFINFIESMKGNIPGRIDSSVLTSYAGSVQAQLRSALRFFDFVGQDGVVQDALKAYVEADEDSRKQITSILLRSSYAFLFDNPNFSLSNATPKQFDEMFEQRGAKGDTINKCQSFFTLMAKDAGIALSPRLTSRQPRRPTNGASQSRANTKANARSAHKQNASPTKDDDLPPTQPPSSPPLESTIFKKTFTGATGGVILTLSVQGNLFDIEGSVRDFIFRLRDQMKEFKSEADDQES